LIDPPKQHDVGSLLLGDSMNPGARLSCRPALGALAVAGVAVAAALVALAVPGCVSRGAAREAATPYNQVVVGRAGDVDFTKARPVPGQLVLDWQVRLPLRGEVSPPERMAVGPGLVIAVESGGGSRLYDGTGALLGERPGAPAGFLPDGSLVAVGGRPMITAYRPDGSILWGGDPWSEARDKLLAGRKADGFGLPPVVSSAGETYCYLDFSLGEERLQALVVYDAGGELVYCDRVPAAATLLLTARGTAFSNVVSAKRGDACREFAVTGGAFTLVRTIYLPSGTGWLRAVGADGTVVCQNPYAGDTLIESYTVYRPGAREAVTFSLPEGHHFAAFTPDGRLYTTQLLAEAVVVTAWVWPTP